MGLFVSVDMKLHRVMWTLKLIVAIYCIIGEKKLYLDGHNYNVGPFSL